MAEEFEEMTPGAPAPDDALKGFRAPGATLDSEGRRRIAAAAWSEATRLEGATSPFASHVVVDLDARGPRRVRGTRRPLLVIEALAVAAAVLIAFVIGTHQHSSHTVTASRIDETTLVQAARATADRPLLPGFLLYRQIVEGRTRTQDTGNVTVEQTVETWIEPDGSGLQEASQEHVVLGRVGDDFVMAPPSSLRGSPGRLDFGDFSYEQLRDLPVGWRDLHALVTERVRSGDPSGSAVASLLASILAVDVTSPLVRAAAVAALFHAGAEPIGVVTLPSGGAGEGLVGRGSNGEGWLVVIDPVSARTLGFATGITGKPTAFDVSTLRAWTEFTQTAVVPIADLGR